MRSAEPPSRAASRSRYRGARGFTLGCSKDGLTLAEVLVALVIAELAVLGAIAIAAAAIQRMNRASTLEQTLTRAHSIWDSLSWSATAGPGADSAGPGVISWTVAADGSFIIVSRVPLADSFVVRGARR